MPAQATAIARHRRQAAVRRLNEGEAGETATVEAATAEAAAIGVVPGEGAVEQFPEASHEQLRKEASHEQLRLI